MPLPVRRKHFRIGVLRSGRRVRRQKGNEMPLIPWDLLVLGRLRGRQLGPGRALGHKV